MFIRIRALPFITVSSHLCWNVNSIANDNFQRVCLIEAQDSIFNYDLISISICETSLNDSIKLPDILHNDYIFVSSQNPTNTRHGGVGLFFKNSLPLKIRNDLSFEESIVVELNFGPKKIFFTVLYSPISLLFVEKSLKKLFSTIFTNILLTTHHLTSKNQSGFRPGDSTTNQLIDLVNDIHRAFDSTKSLEARAIVLDISKAFDKVWHDGLIFKMRQNDVSDPSLFFSGTAVPKVNEQKHLGLTLD